MEFSFDTLVVNLPEWLLLIFTFIMAFAITLRSIPTIVTVADKKGLYEQPGSRRSHTGNVPTLGGVAIYAGLIISVCIFSGIEMLYQLKFILAAMIGLFFTGIKDDILIIDPKKKLIAQIGAAALIVIFADIRITHFHGFALINEIPYVVSILFTIFVFVVIINGFNLIDGIDGLASGVAIVTSLTFGIWFIIVGHHSCSVMSFALAGSLIAFFRYNVFGKKNKIFLGDTGSLSVGLILAVLSIQFLEFEFNTNAIVSISSIPAVTFGILIVPLFDTLRVFALRVFGGDSPFKADRKHIHHRLLELGYSHLKASLIIITVNLGFIFISFLLKDLGNMKLVVILLMLATGLSYIPVHMINRRIKNNK